MINNRQSMTSGAINAQMIALIGLVLLLIGASGVAAWAYMNYEREKSNVDSRTALAVAAAKKEQADIDETKFAEREKEPNRDFSGPSDYGSVTFKYPKTWSAYIESGGSARGGRYSAYFNPIVVPSVSDAQQYALRVSIDQVAYDKKLASYKSLIEKGDLKSQPITSNGHDGTRLDGSFSKDIRGAAVLFKVRDKTLIVQTDADIFKPDFENIVKTINYNE